MQQPSQNNYIINTEDPAEQERLSVQDTLITRCMGGLLPENKDYSHIVDVLDLACGLGAWALALAAKYPWMQVTGVDISQTMIDYARAQAKVRRSKVTFDVMDLRNLTYEEQSFDFINARIIGAALRKEDWPVLWQRCYDILRPGGILRWSESDIPQSNSAAFEELFHLLTRAMHQLGQSLSPTGYNIGLQSHMVWMLKDAHFNILEERTYALDASNYTDRWQLSAQDGIATLH